MAVVHDINEFTDKINEGLFTKKFLVEGDSWTSHPMPGARHLGMQFDDFASNDHLILNLSSPGDEAREIFKPGGKQMKQLKKLINTTNWGDKFDLIFLSAAGNDIVGPEICHQGYVKNKRDFPYLSGRELITDSFYNTVSDVVAGYEKFLSFRDKSLNATTPVVTHVYSYLKPREVGSHLGPIPFNKGWIARHLKHQGITNEGEQIEIAKEFLDAFYKRIVILQKKFTNFLVVDTRPTLSKSGNPDLSLWHDEIHPNDKGFKRLAKQIRDEAITASFWPK